MYHLISFLGKVQNKKENDKPIKGEYTKAKYRFSNGQESETSFFGLALQEHLKPERLVVLGTTGSMWDVFVESFNLEDDLLDKRVELINNADKDKVTQEQLNQLAPLLSKKLKIICELRIIPYGENDVEQTAILQEIAKGINKDDKVSLDVTHGLRHLPMITLTSTFYLKNVLKVQIEGIYYGAFDMRHRNAGVVPVLKLDGLLNIASWVSELDAFDKDGDYGVFTDLLVNDGMDKKQANLLKRASFYERNFNTAQANQILSTFQLPENLSGASELFKKPLQERLNKAKGNLLERQKKFAEFYLNNGDYARATIFMFEAFITSQMENPSHDYRERERAKDEYEKNMSDDYKLLRNLRNTLAHGNEPNDKIKSLVAEEDILKPKLKSLMKKLLRNTT